MTDHTQNRRDYNDFWNNSTANAFVEVSVTSLNAICVFNAVISRLLHAESVTAFFHAINAM